MKTIRIEKVALSDDALIKSELINGELIDSMSLYYGKFRDSDTRAWGNLMLRKRRLEQRQDKLSLDRVFTTGLPQGEAGRYYYFSS